MNWLRTLLAAVVLMATVNVPPGGRAWAQGSVEISEFYERLEPYGRWVEHPGYGHVWSPDIDPDWRPYTRGRWAFTEEHGWLWESEEPFGWAVYHYGRWFLDENMGWLWVPGTEWGPAWVAWRHSDEHVGWVPLPPEAEWRDNALSFSTTYYDRPHYSPAWVFVPIAALTTYGIYRHVLAPRRNTVFLRSTTWVPRGHHQGRHGVYNAGFDRRRYELLTRRPITPVRIVVTDRPHSHAGGGRPSGGSASIQIFRPRVVGTVAATPPPRVVPREQFRPQQQFGARPGTDPRSTLQQQHGTKPHPQRQPGIHPTEPRIDPAVGRVTRPSTPSDPVAPSLSQPRVVTPTPRYAPQGLTQPDTAAGRPSARPGTFLPGERSALPPPDRAPQRQLAPPQPQPSYAPAFQQQPQQAQPRFLPPGPSGVGDRRSPNGPSGGPGAGSGQQMPPRAANAPPGQGAPQGAEKRKRPERDGQKGPPGPGHPSSN